MRYIYVDNFRGFHNTLLPLEDVNFFVGENSTGKTSIMALIYLFHSSSLWISEEFIDESEQIELGDYDDIVSMHSKDKKCFQVGALRIDEKGDDPSNITYDAFLMTFSKVGVMPKIKYYTLVTENKRVDINIQQNRVLYRITTPDKIERSIESVRMMFESLANSHKAKKRPFRLKELKQLDMSKSYIAAINSVIKSVLRSEPISSRVVSFAWPRIYNLLTWIAPIRTRPQNIYFKYGIKPSPEGQHTPYLIKKILEDKDEAKEFRKFLQDFGKESGLFEEIKTIKYGRKKEGPFELDVVLSGKGTKITNVGYGVSQVLPIIVEIFSDPPEASFLIQQPEIHLHPKAQAALGDVYFNLSALENKQFIIETHSDFIIDRFRINYKKKKKKRPTSQIVFFENSYEGNILSVIAIDENGGISKEQPEGYRDFFLKEDLRVLGY